MLIFYTVRQEDTAESIAGRFCTSVSDLVRLNGAENIIPDKRVLIRSQLRPPKWLCGAIQWLEEPTKAQLEALTRLLAEEKQCCVSKCEPCGEPLLQETTRTDCTKLDNCGQKANPDSRQKCETENKNGKTAGCAGGIDSADNCGCGKNIQEESAGNKGGNGEKKSGIEYTVCPGDTAASIAARFGLTPRIVQCACGGEAPASGAHIVLPSIRSRRYFYTVRIGDTVGRIARRYCTNAEGILTLNCIFPNEKLMPGMRLVIVP